MRLCSEFRSVSHKYATNAWLRVHYAPLYVTLILMLPVLFAGLFFGAQRGGAIENIL